MTIALVGSRGQLGQQLAAVLRDVVPLDRPAHDLADPDHLTQTLRTLRPRWVINAAAYNFVDRAETEPEPAFAINALGVRALARCCTELDCVLVHFSSDHVFGRDAGRTLPYREDEEPGPVNVYGTSKLAGEYFIRALCPRHLIVRSCGLYGPHGTGGKGTNFVEAILRQAKASQRLAVVDDQYCTPTAATDLAAAVAALLAAGRQGLFHVTNADACSWFEFATAILEESGLAAELTPITTAAYGAAARRPGFSILDCTMYDQLGLVARRPWREALRAYLRSRPN